jgi:HD-GYP domain-containing protein (c-di-GMP phosphodiesterase class II)
MTETDSRSLQTQTLNDKGLPVDFNSLREVVFDSVRSGAGLPVDIYDESGVLLLPAGSQVTKEFLDVLRRRGITRVRLGQPVERPPLPEVAEPHAPPSADDLHTKASRMLDERLAGELQRPVIYHPVKRWRRPRLSIDDLKTRAAEGVGKHEATSAAVADLCDGLDTGERISPIELQKSVRHFVEMAAVDFDLLPLIVALRESQDEYLYDHCVNVALLSTATASQLGLDRERIMEIGLGGILHDIGMLRVPVSIRLAPRPLTESERHEIHRHPLHTLDMLAALRGIPQSVKFIAYQAHERMDGQGYPRGRSGGQLHEYAKIVSIADVYAAMTHERPYRPAMLPYVAAKTVLADAASDRFDRRLVRAFLDTISLFPIGSRVGLSTGCTARVLRANPGLHTRPVVEELSAAGSPTGHIIDLSHEDAPRVTRAT